ncbi:MAG: pyridoxamine 5'-phosphate oxidase family protein [Proteobacteria bacterium]|nr:pyridoxamine 5'-phosphate oxidase family protein [Pseudomonadota bacterium]
MRHALRREDRRISPEEARELFAGGEYLFMATVGQDGRPYGVPLSYALINNVVYIHCASNGRKLDNLAACPWVCLNVVGPTQPVYDGSFSTYYESAIIEGQARLVTDEEEKNRALLALANKYLPEHMDKAEKDIARSWQRTLVYGVTIDSISGKAKRKKPVINDE